jgi:hypothetical protein
MTSRDRGIENVLMSRSADRSTSDECEHAEFEIHPDSVATDIDQATLPYGHITQRARCIACGHGIERRLQLAAWGPWRAASN